MATDRVLFSLLERAGQLLREGTTGVDTNLTKPELLEFAATARALAAGAEAEIEVTTLQQRVLNYYTIHGTSADGCDVNDVAAGLCIDLAKVRSAVDFLEGEGELYSTIDEDHHKFTMEKEELAAAAQLPLRGGKASADESDVEDALTPFQQRLLVRYKEFATGDEGLDINDLAELVDLPELRSAVDFLVSEGYLYSTIDEDHHKYTAF